MGSKINVDINNLSTDCNKMTDLISELKNLTQKITDAVGEFDVMWNGIAKDEFIKNIVSDIAEIVDLTDNFDFVRYAMQTAIKIYSNDSEEVVNIFLRQISDRR